MVIICPLEVGDVLVEEGAFILSFQNREGQVNKRVAGCLAVVLLVASVLLPVGCVSKSKFASDPVSWSFVSGDGSWDSNSRRWTVSLSPGETKSIVIQLYNSSSRRIVVYTVSVAPTDTILLNPQGRYPVAAGGTINITFTATAYQSAASGTYTMDYGHSFNSSEP